MKKTILITTVLALMLAGCQQNTKTTEKDVKRAEKALFNEDQTLNPEAIVVAVETFSNYAEENPEAENAAEYLFKAFEISVNTHQDPQQSIALANQILERYPDFDNIPVALFMLASFVYDEQLHDLDKARETYQRIVDDYPDSPFANDAALSIQQLGMSPEDLIRMFEANQPK